MPIWRGWRALPTMDQEIQATRHDIALGVAPPDFALAKTLLQMNQSCARAAPESPAWWNRWCAGQGKEHRRRLGRARRRKSSKRKYYPALDRQIALVKRCRSTPCMTPACGGCPMARPITGPRSKLGDHRQEPGRIFTNSAWMWWPTARPAGCADEGAGHDQRQRGDACAPCSRTRVPHPNTDAAKDKLIADLNAKVRAVRGQLPQCFGALPKAECDIKRVPQEYRGGPAAAAITTTPRWTENAPASTGSICAIPAEVPELDAAQRHLSRKHSGPSSAAFAAAGSRPAADPQDVVLLGLYRRLGALCRTAGGGDGHV